MMNEMFTADIAYQGFCALILRPLINETNEFLIILLMIF